MSARVAILLSGRGSNFLALHGAMERGEVPARIERVISNVPDAAGLARAKDLRIPSLCYPHRLEPSREAHEAKILAALRDAVSARQQHDRVDVVRILLTHHLEDAHGRVRLSVGGEQELTRAQQQSLLLAGVFGDLGVFEQHLRQLAHRADGLVHALQALA